MKDKTPKKIRKYKGGGYVIETQIAPGIIGLEMDSKGFYKEFAKPLIEEETPSKKLIEECKECKYCDGIKTHMKECFLRKYQMIPTDLPKSKPQRKLKSKLQILKDL